MFQRHSNLQNEGNMSALSTPGPSIMNRSQCVLQDQILGPGHRDKGHVDRSGHLPTPSTGPVPSQGPPLVSRSSDVVGNYPRDHGRSSPWSMRSRSFRSLNNEPSGAYHLNTLWNQVTSANLRCASMSRRRNPLSRTLSDAHVPPVSRSPVFSLVPVVLSDPDVLFILKVFPVHAIECGH